MIIKENRKHKHSIFAALFYDGKKQITGTQIYR